MNLMKKVFNSLILSLLFIVFFNGTLKDTEINAVLQETLLTAPDVYSYIKSKKVHLIYNEGFIIGYSYKYKQPIFTLSYLSTSRYQKNTNRKIFCKFKEDKRIPKEYRSTLNDYKNTGYDRGHITAYNTIDYSIQSAKESCLLSNISPQIPTFNRGKWKHLEEEVQSITIRKNIYILTIVYFDNCTYNDKFMKKIQVPEGFIKLIFSEDFQLISRKGFYHK